MAVHEDPKSSEKNSGEDDLRVLNPENLQSNMKSIFYSRTFLSIIGGVVAGIWGFTGLMGFVFYFLIMLIASVGFAAKAKFSIHKYFDGWNRITVDGFLGGLLLCCARVYAHGRNHYNPGLGNQTDEKQAAPFISGTDVQSAHLYPFSRWSFVLFWTFAYDIVHIF